MSKKAKTISEEEIDRLVVEHADDDSAWEKPVRVRRSKIPVVALPIKPTSEDSQETLPAVLKANESK